MTATRRSGIVKRTKKLLFEEGAHTAQEIADKLNGMNNRMVSASQRQMALLLRRNEFEPVAIGKKMVPSTIYELSEDCRKEMLDEFMLEVRELRATNGKLKSAIYAKDQKIKRLERELDKKRNKKPRKQKTPKALLAKTLDLWTTHRYILEALENGPKSTEEILRLEWFPFSRTTLLKRLRELEAAGSIESSWMTSQVGNRRRSLSWRMTEHP